MKRKHISDDPSMLKLSTKSINSEHVPLIYVHGELNMDFSGDFCRAVEDVNQHGSELILLDIASNGGDVNALNQILSTMLGYPDVKFATYCSAMAYSAAAVILAMGAPGMRFISPYATAMIHSVLYDPGMQGIEEHRAEFGFIERQNTRIIEALARAMKTKPGKLLKKIRDTGARNLWLFPEEALELGLVDHIGVPELLTKSEVGLRANLIASKS